MRLTDRLGRVEMAGWRVALAAALLGMTAVLGAPPAAAATRAEAAPRDAAPLVRVADEAIAGQYVVVLREGNSTSAVAAAARADGVTVTHEYGRSLNGFAARLTAAELADLRADPRVAYIAEDGVASAEDTQFSPPSWGLDRIDQHAWSTPSDSYTYDATGDGVTAYVIDSGIRASHNDLSGRVGTGVTFINDGNGTSDCDGHGTHIAGTIGGETYGVAKDVDLIPVRVLDCNGSGAWSAIIAGVDWVTANHAGTAVANLSIGRPDVYLPLIEAVEESIADGVTYVMSAGNNSKDACGHSPGGSVPTGITVGATSQGDYRVGGTNWGPCLDISAPGEEIVSAGHTSDTAAEWMDGTSFAAAHVTGVAALHLEDNPADSPADVKDAILAAATNQEPGEDGPSKGSPARILYSRL